MPEVGGFEQFDGLMGSEAAEMSDEQVREEARQSQAAKAQLQKEEGKAKQNDNILAQIIVQFLGQPANTDLFLLISRVIAQNIPSELIVAILSLIDEGAQTQVTGLLAAGTDASPASSGSRQSTSDFGSLGAEQKKKIDDWLENMRLVSLSKPHKTLDSMLLKVQDRPLSPALIQLSAVILQRYLEKQGGSFELAHLRDFMQDVFVKIAKELANLVAGQRKLS